MADKNSGKKTTAAAVAGAILGIGATLAAEALKDKKNRDRVLKALNDVKKEVLAKAGKIKNQALKNRQLKKAKKAALDIKSSAKKVAKKAQKSSK